MSVSRPLWLAHCALVLALALPLPVGAAAHAVKPEAERRGYFPYPDEGQRLIGRARKRVLSADDTLAAIARIEGVGYGALRQANPSIDPWLPAAGARLQLPRPLLLPDVRREGIVINLAELRLFYFDPREERLLVFPVGIGVEGFETPEMATRTVARIHRPSWTPTPSIRAEHAARGSILPRVVPPGPDNPMGSYAIQLAAAGYFIHGTNRPIGVGQRVSHGCIRLYEDHIETLATSVPNGTPVLIVRQPYKAAWQEGKLYLEAHPDRDDPQNLTDMVRAVVDTAIASATTAEIDWDLAYRTAQEATGIPVVISR